MQRLLRLIQHPHTRHWLWVALATFLIGGFIIVSTEIREAQAGQSETIVAIDQVVLKTLVGLRNPGLNGVSVDVTALGSGTVLSLLTTCLVLFTYFQRRYFLALHIFSAGAGAGLLTHFLKHHFGRSRPDALFQLVEVQGFSYPSGHSMASAAVYFTLAIVFCSQFKSKLPRLIIGALFVLIIFSIGASRMYLGVHYFSDVLAGILIGISWASLLTGLSSYVSIRKLRRSMARA